MKQVDAAPYPFAFDPATAALVIIDMQRDFLEPGGFGAALGNDVRCCDPPSLPRPGCCTPAVPQASW